MASFFYSALIWTPSSMSMVHALSITTRILQPTSSSSSRQHFRYFSSSTSSIVSSRRWRSSFLRSSSSSSSNDSSATIITTTKTSKKKSSSLQSGREKRKKFIGLAKAVDRGQFQYTYNPGGKIDTNGKQKFIAKSGLPNIEKSFCVLGIESSCDDTGGELIDVLMWFIFFSSISTYLYLYNVFI